MKCAKPASAPAYRAASAAQYSLGAGAMRSKKVFFLYCIIFFLKSQTRSPPGLVAEPALARFRVRICERWRTRQHIRTASPSDMGSHSAASRERKRAQRQASMRAHLSANAGAYGGASSLLLTKLAHMGCGLARRSAEAGVSGS